MMVLCWSLPLWFGFCWSAVSILCGGCVANASAVGITSIQLQNGTVCTLPEEVLPNYYMCYHAVVLKDRIVDYEVKVIEALSLVRPCPTCFPELTTVTVNTQVPILGDVCEVTPLYRKPRAIESTINGVKILTTPGYTLGRGYSSDLLCVWNVACDEGEKLYFNVTQQNTEGRAITVGSSTEQCPDYVQVMANNVSQLSCGNEAHKQLKNQVGGEEVEIIFRSDTTNTGKGFRMDITCFNADTTQSSQTGVATGTASSNEGKSEHCTHIGDSDNSSLTLDTPNAEQQAIIHAAFNVHYQLLHATEMCKRGVRLCARVDFTSLAKIVNETTAHLAIYSNACNLVVKNMVQNTLDLLT